MRQDQIPRRDAAATAVGTMAIPATRGAAARGGASPIRLGGPVYVKTDDPVALARAHRQLGYGAAYCPNASLNDGARIRAIADAFAAADVVIAEVGRWVNLMMNIHFVEVRPGLGVLDYPTYLRRLSRLPQRPPLMMEHLSSAEEYDQARLHLFEVGKQTGIPFG